MTETRNSNIAVYYHVYLHSDKYRLWLDEQIGAMKRSGLLQEGQLYVNIMRNCNDLLLDDCLKYISTAFPEIKNIKVHTQPRYMNRKEGVTLNELYVHACSEPTTKFLYIHTKGIIRPFKCDTYFPSNDAKPWVYNWRKCMQDNLVKNYKRCLEDLNTHDVVGVKWKPTPVPHYSGNFWWANGSYIKTLESPLARSRYWRWGRFSCEFWVCGNRVEQILGLARNMSPVLGNPICKKYTYSISRSGPTL